MRFMMIALLILATACSSDNSSNSEENSGPTAQGPTDENSPTTAPAEIRVQLPEVSGACLNIEKYYARVRSFPGALPARKVTKDMSFRATGNNIPRNFLLRLAAGNFKIQDGAISEMPEFVNMTQKGCESVTFHSEGRNELYEIIRSSPSSVTLENEWSGLTTITWKSPTSVQFETTSVIGDYLCDPGSRGRLTTTYEITWGDSGIFTDILAANVIDTDYLKMVQDATGYRESLYSDGGNSGLIVSRLKDMQSRTVRSELYECY